MGHRADQSSIEYSVDSSPSPPPRAVRMASGPAQGRSSRTRQDLPSRLRALQQAQQGVLARVAARRDELWRLDVAEQEKKQVLRALDAEARARRECIEEQQKRLDRLRRKQHKERRRSRSKSKPRSSDHSLVPPEMLQALVQLTAFQVEVAKQMARQMRRSRSRSRPKKSSRR